MKAVNLIPSEERRGGGAGAAGRSGGAVYVLLGTLGVLVVLMGAYVMSGRQVDEKNAELARVEAEVQQVQAQADSLAAYTRFTDLRAKRVQTVSQLASTRFDWSHALREIARVVPENAWLTSLVGTMAPSVQVEGASTGASSMRGSQPVPAIEISGCTTSQTSVAKMMARMRLVDGVERVSLATSEKADAAGGAAGGGGDSSTGGDCRNGSDRFPKFDLVIFFRATGAVPPAPGATPAPPAGDPSAAPAAGSATPAGQTSTTPGSTPAPAEGTSTTPSATPASGGTTP